MKLEPGTVVVWNVLEERRATLEEMKRIYYDKTILDINFYCSGELAEKAFAWLFIDEDEFEVLSIEEAERREKGE